MGHIEGKPPAAGRASALIEQRRIEFGVLGPVYRELAAEAGKEFAMRVFLRAVSRLAHHAGLTWGTSHPERNLEGIRLLWEKLAEGGALNATVSHNSTGLEIKVRKCAYADMYREAGAEDLGRILSCSRDEAFIEGFSENIRFTRTQCLLEKDDCCHMMYEVKK